MLWIIAAEKGTGELPSVKDLAFKVRLTEEEVNKTISSLSDWLE